MTRRTRFAIVIFFFIAAFIHASIWAAITPLWQIPDEAAHYEYVRLLVKLGRPPTKEDADPAIQADILRSMWENHYWEYLGYKRPDHPPTSFLAGGWTSGGDIPDTGIVEDAFVGAFSNLDNSQPIYYMLLSPIQQAVVHWQIDDQLRALRTGSRVLFALGVAFVVLTAIELFGDNVVLFIGTGLLCVLQPMFAYIGSGVNNDVGVFFVTALLAWQLANAWQRGFAWWRIGLISITTLLAVFTKRTAVFTLLLVPTIIGSWFLSRAPQRVVRRIIYTIIATAVGMGLIASVLYIIPGTTPSNWTSSNIFCSSWTSKTERTGIKAFMVQGGCSVDHSLTTNIVRPLGMSDGSPVVFSTWVRADTDAKGILRLRDNSGHAVEREFMANNKWQLVDVTLSLAPSASRLIFTLASKSSLPIYADDMRAVIQASQDVELSLPNPSTESVTPLLAEILLSISQVVGVSGQMALAIQDYRANIAALPQVLPNALAFVNTSYWGKFGIFARAQTPQVPAQWGIFLAILAGLSAASSIIQIFVRRRLASFRTIMILFLFGIALLFLQTLAPLLSLAAQGLWLPQGRYLFGGMALIAPILIYGWTGWLSGKWRWVGVFIVTLIFVTLTLTMMIMVNNFFAI
jgi:hypothetical protein